MKEYRTRDPCTCKCRKCKKKFTTNEWYVIKDSDLAKYMNEPIGIYVDCPKCMTTLSEDDICKEKN